MRGLCGGQSHRLFDEYMLAQGQRSTSMIVVEVWAAAHDYGLEALNCKQFRNRRTSHGHTEIVSNFSRPAEIALLDCNQFRCRVCQECRDMSVSSPPSRSDYAAFDSFWHETTSTIETMHGCGDNCRRLAMPIRDQYRPPASFTSTSRNEGRLACNGKLPVELFCAKRKCKSPAFEMTAYTPLANLCIRHSSRFAQFH